MDVTKMLEDLKEERAQIEEAILTLERLARGRGRRRGRPPLWLVEARKRAPEGVAVASPVAAVAVAAAKAGRGKASAGKSAD